MRSGEPLIIIAAKMVGMYAYGLRHCEWLGPVRRAALQAYCDRMLPSVTEEERE